MSYSYEELKSKNVSDLRKIAKESEQEALKGYSQLNKEHLLEAICKAFNVEMHAHHEVVGVDKGKIKSEIKALKAKREGALVEKNRGELKRIRRQIHSRKRALRRATV
ncbi:MAG: Rho termination factor N-terminal domain-containing protein [Proteobacteria bacterium]|nr:Rho termination factor N-terminal domain-containing protein [Pseudomonadota bacterium]